MEAAQRSKSFTVVVATDGSPCAQIALDLVRTIEWPAETFLHVVTSTEPSSAAYGPSMLGAVGDSVEREVPLIGGMAAALDQLAQPMRETGAVVETHVLGGRPATAIVEMAEAVGADLIVVGSRGHGTIGSMVLGSVSAEVTDHAHCPVLVARRTRWQRAMVGVDGSPFARLAEDVIESWPIFAKLPIDAISVAETDLTSSSLLALGGYAGSVNYPETNEALVSEHQQFADEARERLESAARRAIPFVRTGDAATQLLRAARERDTDVIVVGTHGRTGLIRALAGSVARNVMLHAQCSVLVVRETRPLT